ncbi:hypothetical protein Hanom_Chr14g01302351 [Helianthus anomalus]
MHTLWVGLILFSGIEGIKKTGSWLFYRVRFQIRFSCAPIVPLWIDFVALFKGSICMYLYGCIHLYNHSTQKNIYKRCSQVLIWYQRQFSFVECLKVLHMFDHVLLYGHESSTRSISLVSKYR